MNVGVIALVYSAAWGFGFTVSKIALESFDALTLLTIQLSSSSLFLLGALVAVRGWKALCSLSIKHGLPGLLEPGMSYLFGTVGLSLTSATNASLIGSSEILLTIVASALFLRESVRPRQFALAIVGSLGVAVIALQDLQPDAFGAFWGDALVLTGVLFAVAYVLASKRLIATSNPLSMVTSQQLFGLLAIVVFRSVLANFSAHYDVRIAAVPGPWLPAVVSGVLSYAVAFLCYLSAIRRLPA
ncbi:MAG: DMT family transporter, partial [Spirochaetales bacterium]|nr:DMT family transporter [Spirochaetales bacterium]